MQMRFCACLKSVGYVYLFVSDCICCLINFFELFMIHFNQHVKQQYLTVSAVMVTVILLQCGRTHVDICCAVVGLVQTDNTGHSCWNCYHYCLKKYVQLLIVIGQFHRKQLIGLSMYRVGHKNVALYYCPYFCQLLIDFHSSFTGTLCTKFAIM